MDDDQAEPTVGLGISFGGTKVAAGLVSLDTCELVAQTARLEWRNEATWDPAQPVVSLALFIAEQAGQLVRRVGLTSADIGVVGIGWPGPGSYASGLLSATFIPGADQPIDVHGLVRAAVEERVGPLRPGVAIRSGLDVVAAARGELRAPGGALHMSAPTGDEVCAVLNVATGVAGCLVAQQGPRLHHEPLGATYGQWGRYLLRDLESDRWEWRPTLDGSTPAFDRSVQVRLTEWCGGPALARRWAADSRSAPMLGARNVAGEAAALMEVTAKAREGEPAAVAFLDQVGRDLGRALACALDGLGARPDASRAVLTGGVGQNLGTPAAGRPDRLVAAVSAEAGLHVVRSHLGREAELVGAVVP